MKTEVLLSIHRHWIWANWIKKQFGDALGQTPHNEIDKLILEPAGTYMCLWYGLLFAVCEGLRKEKVVISLVQREIDSVYDSLKLFRNAVFHVQPKYWSRKLLDFMVVEGNATKVHRIHNGIGEWLLEEVGRSSKKLE